MGRRSLRRVDPKLDLSRYFKVLDEMPESWNPVELFQRAAPLEIDVGCGKGMFIASAAEEHPDRNFLGVEKAKRYAHFSAARAAKRNLDNVAVVSGDAQRLFAEVLQSERVAAVHVYFPDPWWKARHKKRRVLNEAFVRNIERVLAPDGRFHFWTDVQEYFDATCELVAQVTQLQGPMEIAPREAQHDLDYQTHFERRTRLSEQPVYRSEFRKPR